MTPVRQIASIFVLLLLSTHAVTTAADNNGQPSPAGRSALGKPGAGLLPSPIGDEDYWDEGQPSPVKVKLGQLLFYDKILSGNRNTSCATCHHSLADTGDGLSLPVGEGGRGLGMTRDTGSGLDAIEERVPRNAPPVFNLGAKEFQRMFYDGRLEVDPGEPSGFRSPAEDRLPLGLDNVLAAQAMFPVTSPTEMAGQGDENDVAEAAAVGDVELVWELLAQRLRANEEYVTLFAAAFEDVNLAADITFAHAANAIGAFEASAWRADSSPFDRYLRGDRQAMSLAARRGMVLFYTRGGCSSCHSGPFQTDHDFHAIGMPQIGPGKGDGDGLEDYGRERVTGSEVDRYRFRTPSLRNVALTGPWGHDGAFNSLRGIVLHHLDPEASLTTYDGSQAVLPSREDLDTIDFAAMENPEIAAAIAVAAELEPVTLADREIDLLVEFLLALTDPTSIDLRADVPESVPSGLPLAE
jgi:cytochrome c peroxidase